MAQSESDIARLTVRLGAVRNNYLAIAAQVGAVKVAPVVKADGYGTGMVPVSRALAETGADTFFVARVQEGVELRQALPQARIYVLDGVTEETVPVLRAHALTPVLNRLEEVAAWSAAARDGRTSLDAAIQIDTGMSRSGLSRADTDTLGAEATNRLRGVNLALILSHLSCSDDAEHPMNRTQLERFRAALAKLPPAPASLSASAGVGLGREYDFDMVRPGLALYGGNPQPKSPNPYRVVARLSAPVLQVRRVDLGDSVGYGATFTAGRPLKLVTVALGYADGLARTSGGRGRAALAGVRVPFAGRISMDLCVLDASAVPDSACRAGAEVEFFGDTVTLEEAAEAAGTVNYETLTRVSARVPRAYVE
ncbi:MAG: alanine racemase [Alphaproteobacteria bacterium]